MAVLWVLVYDASVPHSSTPSGLCDPQVQLNSPLLLVLQTTMSREVTGGARGQRGRRLHRHNTRLDRRSQPSTHQGLYQLATTYRPIPNPRCFDVTLQTLLRGLDIQFEQTKQFQRRLQAMTSY